MSKTFFDIFQKKPSRKKEIQKQKIIADYREKNSLVPASLIHLDLDVEFRELKVADYLINGIAIERKTISDFISSMLNGRLVKQLEELQQYKDKLLIIEGIDNQELYSDETKEGMHPNSVRGFLLSIILKHKIPIIFSKDSKDTAQFISVLSRKKEKESRLNVKKKSLNKKEQLQFILESFPGIGPSTAKKLLKEFKTIKNIINSPQEGLKKTIGKKAKIFRLIDERY